MQINPLRAGIERGALQIGTWVNLVRNPAILTLLKAAGLDFARVDMEHSTPSIETIADMALLARGLNFPIVVRPPTANREWITRLLDVGVWNLHCPQVETLVTLPRSSRPHAMRRGAARQRGAQPGNRLRHDGKCCGAAGFRQQAGIRHGNVRNCRRLQRSGRNRRDGWDRRTHDRTADLAQDLGVFGLPEEARVLDEKRDQILAAARKHGKTCAMLCSSKEQARHWKEAGALLLAYSSDSEILHNTFKQA